MERDVLKMLWFEWGGGGMEKATTNKNWII